MILEILRVPELKRTDCISRVDIFLSALHAGNPSEWPCNVDFLEGFHDGASFSSSNEGLAGLLVCGIPNNDCSACVYMLLCICEIVLVFVFAVFAYW